MTWYKCISNCGFSTQNPERECIQHAGQGWECPECGSPVIEVYIPPFPDMEV